MQVSNNSSIYTQMTTTTNIKTTSESSFNSFFNEETKKEDDVSIDKTASQLQEESENISTKNEKTDMDKLDALFEDIYSLLKTGLTVSEVEALEKLLIELKNKIKEGNYSQKEIEAMLSNAEKAIVALQKRVTGEAIIELEGTELKQEETKGLDTTSTKFLERIESAISELNELKTPKHIKDDSANESELLSMIKEFRK